MNFPLASDLAKGEISSSHSYQSYQRQRQLTLGDLLLENRIVFLQGEIHYANANDVVMIYVVILAMAGSLMISYTRARAEALGIDCTVGIMQRAERVILIGAAALLFGEQGNGAVLRVVLWGLAILTNLTVLQRILWVYLNTRPEGIAVGNAVWKMPEWLRRKLDKENG